MKIILPKAMPNLRIAATHEITNITLGDGQSTASVISYDGNGGLCWSDTYEIDATTITGNAFEYVANWLVGAGRPFAGGTVAVNLAPIELVRATLLRRVDYLRDVRIASGCLTPAGRIQTDEQSIRNLQGSVQTAKIMRDAGLPFQIRWKMEDNSIAVLDASGMIEMGMAVMRHIQASYDRSWAIKDDISDPARSLASLQGYDLNTKWIDASPASEEPGSAA